MSSSIRSHTWFVIQFMLDHHRPGIGVVDDATVPLLTSMFFPIGLGYNLNKKRYKAVDLPLISSGDGTAPRRIRRNREREPCHSPGIRSPWSCRSIIKHSRRPVGG